jgi:hypothetical protein
MKLYCFRFFGLSRGGVEHHIYKIEDNIGDPFTFMKYSMAGRAIDHDYLISTRELPILFESIDELRRRHGGSRYNS